MNQISNDTQIERLKETMAALRAPDGCPWDREQTHQSLKVHLLEECAEVLDAIDENDPDNMKEELGDLLLHIVFHSQIAKENGWFSFEEVAKESTEKILRRHPHVFGDERASNADEVVDIWEEMKRKEKKTPPKSVTDGVPKNMTALMQATKVQKKVAKYGFDWENEFQIIAKVEEELEELKEVLNGTRETKLLEEEIGDLLFSVVNLCRFLKCENAEELLRQAVKKFIRRFNYIENSLAEQGKPLASTKIETMEELWRKAKEMESK